MSGRNDRLMRRYSRATGLPLGAVQEAYRTSPDRGADRSQMTRVVDVWDRRGTADDLVVGLLRAEEELLAAYEEGMRK